MSRKKLVFIPLAALLIAGLLPFAKLARAVDTPGYALRFYGHGYGDIDRIKIPLDAPPTNADVGSTDFTLEWWMKANLADNPSGPCATGSDAWINGNIIIDRDIFGNGDYGDYGVSLYGGRIAFGVHNGSSGATICGTSNVADDNWHHIAIARHRSDGYMYIYVDGNLEASADGPDGDISYRDGRSTSYSNDPYLVLGAEKHDAGPEYPSYNGLIEELRLSDILRYTANFTRPSQPFIADSNTRLLYHFDEGSGTILTDSSTIAGSPVNGILFVGGSSPAGPIYVVSDAPIGDSIPTPTPTPTSTPTPTPAATPTPTTPPPSAPTSKSPSNPAPLTPALVPTPNCPTGFVRCVSSGPSRVGDTPPIRLDTPYGTALALQTSKPIHDTYLEIKTHSGAPLPNSKRLRHISPIFQLTAEYSFNGLPMPRLRPPVLLILPYDQWKAAPDTPIRLARLNPKSSTWEHLPRPRTVVNPVTRVAAAIVYSPGFYSVVQ